MDNVECRPFIARDYVQIKGWYEKRNLSVPHQRYLPHTGFIADNIACGFLYKTDSAIGILDLFISNPESGREVRNEAIQKITEKLLEEAKMNGVHGVIATSQVKAIKYRAMSFNFKYLGEYSSFFKEI